MIIMAADDSNCLDKLHPYLEALFDYIEAVAQIEGTKNARVLKMIIALLGDIATQFKGNAGVKAKVTMPYIEQGIIYL